MKNADTIFVNYKTNNTSISDSFFETPTELTDNLSYAIKNNIIIDNSLDEIEKSDINKETEQSNPEE